MTKSFTAAIVAIAAIALPAGMAHAAPADGNSYSVQTNDLDLGTSAGRARLDQRIDRAARRVCENGARGARAAINYNECLRAARERAEPQVAHLVERAARRHASAVGTTPGA